VAWADGKIDARERDAVLRAAQASGLDAASPGYGLLQAWLEERPQPDLRRLWKEYIAALCVGLDPAVRRALRDEIVGRARGVAEVAGGFLGLGSKISASEEQVIADLATAFGV
jgi:tellurite resistance protein